MRCRHYTPMSPRLWCIFFFNDTATTEIYTLSLHDALPICAFELERIRRVEIARERVAVRAGARTEQLHRSEEHTSELQSHVNIVCRLLLEKKKTQHKPRQRPAVT